MLTGDQAASSQPLASSSAPGVNGKPDAGLGEAWTPIVIEASETSSRRCHASLLSCPPPPDAPALLRSLPGVRCDEADPSGCPWCLHHGASMSGPPVPQPRRIRVFF